MRRESARGRLCALSAVFEQMLADFAAGKCADDVGSAANSLGALDIGSLLSDKFGAVQSEKIVLKKSQWYLT